MQNERKLSQQLKKYLLDKDFFPRGKVSYKFVIRKEKTKGKSNRY